MSDKSAYRDVDVDVAQYIGPDGEPLSSEKVTARGLLLQAKKTFEPYERLTWQRATMNERFIGGDQFGGFNHQTNEFVFDSWPADLPRINRNLLRNLHLTWISRVTEGDPSVKAWGGESSSMDVSSANVSNKLISAWRQQNGHQRMISRAAWTCASQGTVAFWSTWDTTRGPRGDDGLPLGDVNVEPLAVFDWGTDGSESIDDGEGAQGSDYCFVRRWLTEDLAKELLMKAKITDPPVCAAARSIWGENRQLVECYYYYHKRSSRIPEGHYSIHVGGHVVEDGPFPYDHNKLPLIIWKCTDKPDSPHGGTHVDDAVPLQIGLNRLHASLVKLTYRSADWVKVIGDPEIIDEWDAADQKIPCKDPEKIAALRIVSPPPPPPLLLAQIEEHERMIPQVFGISEAVSGADGGTDSTNAKHLKYISQLDGQKLQPVIKSRNEALRQVYFQMLSLCQQFIPVERQVKLIGEAGLPEILTFMGSDLSTDVYLEPAPGSESTKAAQAAGVEQSATAGFEDPERAKELRVSGQSQTALETITRTAVNQQVQTALQGGAVQPDPTLVPHTAIEILLSAMEQNRKMGPDRLAGLAELMKGYRDLMAQQMQPQQPQAAAPKAPVTKPPQKEILS